MSDVTDIAIIGGGMAGAGLALLLSQKLPGLSVALIEQFPLQVASEDQWCVPSFDARSTALSCSTQHILQMLGVWDRLAGYAEPICDVHVSERHRPLGMLMRASELSLPALGYVIENRTLGNILLDKLLHDSSVNIISPAVVDSIKLLADCAEISLRADTEHSLRCKLVVIADGAQSALRQQIGISSDTTPYDQHALVTNVELALPHKGVAYERFTDTGPIALLPLTDCESRHRAALVWTVPSADVDELMVLADAEFLQRVQDRLGERCGKLRSVGARHCYELQLVQACEQVRSRVVLLNRKSVV